MRVTFAGFAFRFRLRKIRNKRVRNGRTRGRYEGFYVYVEAKDATGNTRDTYLGSYYPEAMPRDQSRVKRAALASSSSTSRRTGKSRGQKARGPTQEYMDAYSAAEEQANLRGETLGGSFEWPIRRKRG